MTTESGRVDFEDKAGKVYSLTFEDLVELVEHHTVMTAHCGKVPYPERRIFPRTFEAVTALRTVQAAMKERTIPQ